jgi:elongin-A
MATSAMPNPSLPSLRSCALRICVLNANNFDSLGDLPVLLVQPILSACSPVQLAHLEDQSPHLRDETHEIWKRHVWERFKVREGRQEGEDWRGMYERLRGEERSRLEDATRRLREKNGRLRDERLAKRIIVIDPNKTVVKGERKRPAFPGMPFR